MAPDPTTLRHLVCSVCGLSNSDSSWELLGEEWVHVCPVKEQAFEDDPTPVTEPMRRKWKPPAEKK